MRLYTFYHKKKAKFEDVRLGVYTNQMCVSAIVFPLVVALRSSPGNRERERNKTMINPWAWKARIFIPPVVTSDVFGGPYFSPPPNPNEPPSVCCGWHAQYARFELLMGCWHDKKRGPFLAMPQKSQEKSKKKYKAKPGNLQNFKF